MLDNDMGVATMMLAPEQTIQLYDAFHELQMSRFLERKTAPKLHQRFELLGRLRREKIAHTVSVVCRRAVDGVFDWRNVGDAVLSMEHAEKRPVRRLVGARALNMHAIPPHA